MADAPGFPPRPPVGWPRRVERRIEAQESTLDEPLTRAQQAKVARGLWRDLGALKADSIRNSFIGTATAAGLEDVTCPKSWRHTFATLLQDARVDPLVRQITLGHAPTGGDSALGMTGVYTHTRPETQRQEILRACGFGPGRWK